jgi:DNA polymerase III subunit gamma/tau
MAYRALYRTYRPSTFDDVVGQQHIVLTLQNAINKNKIAHAYLFCGPRGTGKTTVAKLVAKGVNCTSDVKTPCNECHHCLSIASGQHPDIIEIDAASNNGVDEIRDLIEKVKYSPIEAKFKVYIIDEVHMLSTGAFNALLKTLEEPPSHVIFILATTEPHKVLPTIISRCQRFDFSKVPPKLIAERVEFVLKKENISYDKEVVRLISTLAEGGLRDALSILEQVIAYAKNDLRQEHVHQIYGITTIEEKISLLDSIFSNNVNHLLEQLTSIENKSHDIKRLTSDLIDLLKEAVIFGYTQDELLLHTITKSEASHLLEQQSTDMLLEIIDILIDTFEKYRNATNVHAYFEVCLLKILSLSSRNTTDGGKSYKNSFKQQKTSIQSESTKTFNSDQKVEEKEVAKKEAEEKEVAKKEAEEKEAEKKEVMKKKEEKKETKKQDIQEEKSQNVPSNQQISSLEMRDYSISEIVQCMVAADKDFRYEDTEKWGLLEEYLHDLKWVKIVRLLLPSEIRISGEKFLVVIVENQEIADSINETNNDLLYKELMLQIIGKPKHVIAITQNTFDKALVVFFDKKETNSLPNPIEINEDEIKKEKTVMDKAIDLFGEEFVEMSED